MLVVLLNNARFQNLTEWHHLSVSVPPLITHSHLALIGCLCWWGCGLSGPVVLVPLVPHTWTQSAHHVSQAAHLALISSHSVRRCFNLRKSQRSLQYLLIFASCLYESVTNLPLSLSHIQQISSSSLGSRFSFTITLLFNYNCCGSVCLDGITSITMPPTLTIIDTVFHIVIVLYFLKNECLCSNIQQIQLRLGCCTYRNSLFCACLFWQLLGTVSLF